MLLPARSGITSCLRYTGPLNADLRKLQVAAVAAFFYVRFLMTTFPDQLGALQECALSHQRPCTAELQLGWKVPLHISMPCVGRSELRQVTR